MQQTYESSLSDPASDRSLPIEIRTMRFRRKSWKQGIWQLSTTLTIYWSLIAAVSMAFYVSMLAWIAGTIVCGLFFGRLFILMHDCGHCSLLPQRRTNIIIGSLLGYLLFTPFHHWRRSHARHHTTVTNIDRRGHGYLPILTVREYQNASPILRSLYRIYRFPLIFFIFLPPLYFLVIQRFPSFIPTAWRDAQRSCLVTNSVLLIAGSLMVTSGFSSLIITLVASCCSGSILLNFIIFIEHIFEDSKWFFERDWKKTEASLRSSSYIQMPKILEWLTASVGLHHVHHVDPQIPNYRLRECLERLPELRCVSKLGLRDVWKCFELALIDDNSGKLVGFRDRFH